MTKEQEAKGRGKTAYGDLDVTRKEMVAPWPGDIVVDWTRNTSRGCLPGRTFKGAPCCFVEADVEDLVLPVAALALIKAGKVATDDIGAFIKEHAGPISLLRVGQQAPLTVYVDAKRRPVIVAGYRRLFAFLILAEYGLLDFVPIVHGKSGQGKIEVIQIEQPKDPEGWLRLASANLAENGKRACSPFDIATACRRFALPPEEHGEYGMGYAKAGEMVAGLTRKGEPLSARMVQRYIQFLAQPPDVVGKVHRGEMTLDSALKKASEEGHGRATGARPGIAHTKLRAIPKGALAEIVGKRESNEQRVLTPKEVENFALWVAGADVKPPSWGPKLLEAAEEAARAAKVEAGKKKAPKRKGEAA